MSVEFIDPQENLKNFNQIRAVNTNPKGIIGFLITRKIIENENQAKILLLIIALIFFLVTGYMIYSMIESSSSPVITTAESIDRIKVLQANFPKVP